MVIFWRLFLFSSIEATLIDEQQYFPDWTNRSWPLERSRKYPPKTITDTDCADDIALLANAPAKPETLLHSQERAAAGIVNTHKTEYMCFNQTGDISTLNGCALKLVDKFTYLGSSVSSTETEINTRLAKAWTSYR